ncbi:MAG: hypothetical protein ACTHLW_08585 [Verrucomicrobiota bacterium]
MIWKTDDKDPPVNYIGDAETATVTEALRELWRKYIEEAAPINEEIRWDHLRVEIWLDSGRIIVFPTPSPYHYRVEKAVCQMTCPDLLDSFNEMADSKIDGEFDVWHTKTMQKVANLVVEAARGMEVPKRLARPEVRIICYSYSGEDGPVRDDVLKQ